MGPAPRPSQLAALACTRVSSLPFTQAPSCQRRRRREDRPQLLVGQMVLSGGVLATRMPVNSPNNRLAAQGRKGRRRPRVATLDLSCFRSEDVPLHALSCLEIDSSVPSLTSQKPTATVRPCACAASHQRHKIGRHRCSLNARAKCSTALCRAPAGVVSDHFTGYSYSGSSHLSNQHKQCTLTVG